MRYEELRSALFGLSWGMSAEQVTELGVKLTDKSKGEFGTNYKATNLPKILSDVQEVYLYKCTYNLRTMATE